MSVPDPAARRDAFEKVLTAEHDLIAFAEHLYGGKTFGVDNFNKIRDLIHAHRVAVEGHTRLTVVK